MNYGKSIELFLVNGTADSLIVAELSNWNGKAVKIPRIEVSACNREDIAQAGVYFLFCKEDDGSDSVYIGESENVKDRLQQHMRDYQSGKETYYWNTAVIFIGRDLNKALIRYLEHRFVEIARSSKRYSVLTKNTYGNTVMKESQIAVMEEFVENVKVLINALGYKVLEPLIAILPAIDSDSVDEVKPERLLYLSRKIRKSGEVITAQCKQTNEGFVVLKGSSIEAEDSKVIPNVIKERRLKANIDENHVLQDDELFNSPSYAAAFVVGMNTNGLTDWKTEDGKTLKEIEESGQE